MKQVVTGNPEQVARQLIALAGGRQTKPRVATLVALMESGRVSSHADLQRRMPGIDRVSLYRALEWLTEHRLAHQVTDADGIRRYGYTLAQESHRHPHFHCTRCGLTTCLESPPEKPLRLPKGYRQAAVEVLVKGLCNTCTMCP